VHIGANSRSTPQADIRKGKYSLRNGIFCAVRQEAPGPQWTTRLRHRTSYSASRPAPTRRTTGTRLPADTCVLLVSGASFSEAGGSACLIEMPRATRRPYDLRHAAVSLVTQCRRLSHRARQARWPQLRRAPPGLRQVRKRLRSDRQPPRRRNPRPCYRIGRRPIRPWKIVGQFGYRMEPEVRHQCVPASGLPKRRPGECLA
jgi:hypothetical protein